LYQRFKWISYESLEQPLGWLIRIFRLQANVIVGDGFKYMREHENEFDVIITDSSDPIGERRIEATAVLAYLASKHLF
jgi:hypothetical protein